MANLWCGSCNVPKDLIIDGLGCLLQTRAQSTKLQPSIHKSLITTLSTFYHSESWTTRPVLDCFCLRALLIPRLHTKSANLHQASRSVHRTRPVKQNTLKSSNGDVSENILKQCFSPRSYCVLVLLSRNSSPFMLEAESNSCDVGSAERPIGTQNHTKAISFLSR